MKELYIGLMSGTSADGIDAALVDFSQSLPVIIATHYTAYAPGLKNKILGLCQPGENEIARLAELDVMLGHSYAQAAQNVLKQTSLPPSAVKAIGSHGQTIRHCPPHFTLQIGDPNVIAMKTGITTVADFRRKDMAWGGQGAPLVPAFHQCIFTATNTHRAIVNLGGMANVTFLPRQGEGNVTGFDLGPANVLLDGWILQHQQENYDKNGNWAAQGKVHRDLLARLLADDYFHLPPPKSTGRERFNLSWLTAHLQSLGETVPAVDVQTTLVELTARCIIDAVSSYLPTGEILVCGGGAYNGFLMSRLQTLSASQFTVTTTAQHGFAPDWIEAMAFAWLARQTLNRQTGNLPAVTGAEQATILGGIYPGD